MNAEWFERSKLNGPTGVDHDFKKELVVKYGQRYDIFTFVETGTAHGDLTAYAASNHYDLVHTIEMQQEYYDFAKAKLSRFPYVFCHLGNSSEVLPKVVDELVSQGHIEGVPNPVVYFLDAHYSGPGTAQGDVDTPIVEELNTIGKGPNVIIIDDARLFGGMAYHTDDFMDYPHVDTLEAWAKDNDYSFSFTDDDFVLESNQL
jgi:hypothetical protein